MDCYKLLSPLMGSTIWQISQNVLVEFSNNCPGLIDKIYDINGVLLQERTVKANLIDKEERTKNKNKNIPDNIVRHQFLALLVKVAKDKYITRIKTFSNLIDAVNHSFEAHFIPGMGNNEDLQKWRKERYYNELVDNFIKAHIPILDSVYKSWAPRKDPGRRE